MYPEMAFQDPLGQWSGALKSDFRLSLGLLDSHFRLRSSNPAIRFQDCHGGCCAVAADFQGVHDVFALWNRREMTGFTAISSAAQASGVVLSQGRKTAAESVVSGLEIA